MSEIKGDRHFAALHSHHPDEAELSTAAITVAFRDGLLLFN